ncbi:YczE/YyaS/YitT family protein [Mumia sp. DW29H23]|uniref:membrane protein YczE n=1 Tax=Mumia sp. DW29H23 TaxID=3421241 RepID=UPI003D6890F8
MARPAYTPVSLSPLAQLRTGRLVRRLPQLVFGLMLYGWSMALMIEAGLGLDPWDVFHEGLTGYLPLTFGQITMLVGALVLLLWIPLKQWPGIGTLLNVVLIGIAVDQGLALLEQPDSLVLRAVMLVAGVVLNGLAGALYIGAHLGPGPRDGLFLGLVRRTGYSVRLMRTSVEITVLALGWLLGGTVGVGTVLYALAIGPLVQAFLPLVQVRVSEPEAAAPLVPESSPSGAE